MTTANSKAAETSLTASSPRDRQDDKMRDQEQLVGTSSQPLSAPGKQTEATKPQSRHDHADPMGDDSLLNELHTFLAAATSTRCAACQRPHSISREWIFDISHQWATASQQVLCGIPCCRRICQATTCPGCAREVTSDSGSAKDRPCVQIRGKHVTLVVCCEESRIFTAWALACGWRTTSAPSLLGASSSSIFSQAIQRFRDRRRRRREKKVNKKPTKPAQHSSVMAAGTGYGGDEWLFPPILSRFQGRKKKSRTKGSAQEAINIKEDEVRAAYLQLLGGMLDSWDAEGMVLGSSAPSPVLHFALARSPVVEFAAALIINDSIDDISARRGVYDAVISFIGSLGRQPATSDLVHHPRPIYCHEQGMLSTLSFEKNPRKRKLAPVETGRSLADIFGRLVPPARAILQQAEHQGASFGTEASEKQMVTWSQNVVRVAESLESRQKVAPTDNRPLSEQGRTTASRMNPALDEAKPPKEVGGASSNCLDSIAEAPEDLVFRNHTSEDLARSPAPSMPQKGRMKRIISEISTLHSSLPRGIYIRYGGSRPDILRVLIVGPRDTPYEFGFFEFDMFLPLDYPYSPPGMRFRTTGGGAMRFNPNLYQDGLVCLSLLGTWSGEPWSPAQSTILQVLVSLQSMVFCEQPWYNEPGREQAEDKNSSHKYNNDIRAGTLRYAILPWLDPRTPTPGWQGWRDVVDAHIKHDGSEMIGRYRRAELGSGHPALKLAVREVERGLVLQVSKFFGQAIASARP